MIGGAWQSVEKPRSGNFADARRQAHNAVHWLARIANSYLESEDDGAHVAINWHDETRALRTQLFCDNINVELRLAGLEMQFCEMGRPVPHVLSFTDRTPAHVEAWILVELLHRGIERSRFSKDLPYAANELMLGDSEEHAPENFIEELRSLEGWFQNAAVVCSTLREVIAGNTKNDTDVGPVVVWPETFQLGVRVAPTAGGGASALRAGMSAGDNLRPEPFFFVGELTQAISGDFDPGCVLSTRRIQEENLTSNDVLNFLQEALDLHKSRISD